jgi:hypothetical protein
MPATINAPRGPCRSAAAAASALIGAATCSGDAAAEEWLSIEGSDNRLTYYLDVGASVAPRTSR